MTKKIIFIQICAALFAVPLVSLAATVGGTAVVVAAVASAPAAIVSISSGPTSLPIAIGPCYPFSHSLSVGSTGSDVTALQNFLAAQGDFNVSSTGYFGTLTKAAVGRWQAQNNIAASGSAGNGIFGPLSRAYFVQSCGSGNSGGESGGGASSTTQSLSANPQMGIAPLTVQFTATAPQGINFGRVVDFGDGATGTLMFAPVCSSCNALAVVSHTYTAPGTYTATWTGGVCACPAGGICNCPNIPILGTATVTVDATSTATTTSSGIQQLDAPGSVALSPGGIGEIRNESTYFTLQSIASSSATIQISPVGCWNSFPSDPAPKIVCMIALVPIPLQTLMVGQMYTGGSYTITLSQLSSSTATFAIATK
jgi:peptidoglycan hydrolase-like protein with peptidoglycan-binding domain